MLVGSRDWKCYVWQQAVGTAWLSASGRSGICEHVHPAVPVELAKEGVFLLFSPASWIAAPLIPWAAGCAGGEPRPRCRRNDALCASLTGFSELWRRHGSVTARRAGGSHVGTTWRYFQFTPTVKYKVGGGRRPAKRLACWTPSMNTGSRHVGGQTPGGIVPVRRIEYRRERAGADVRPIEQARAAAATRSRDCAERVHLSAAGSARCST